MSKEQSLIVWKDKNENNLTEKDISDRYLMNIINHIEKGGGHTFFVTEEVIDNLFEIARKRNIDHKCNKLLAIDNMKLKQIEMDIISENYF